jgi:hypothetical protein
VHEAELVEPAVAGSVDFEWSLEADEDNLAAKKVKLGCATGLFPGDEGVEAGELRLQRDGNSD